MPPDKTKIKKSHARQFETGQYFIIFHDGDVVRKDDGGKEEAIESLNSYIEDNEICNMEDIEVFIGERFKPIFKLEDLEIIAPI